MELHKWTFPQILRVTDIPASRKRELWEWLLAVAAIMVGVWFLCAVGQALFSVVVGLM